MEQASDLRYYGMDAQTARKCLKYYFVIKPFPPQFRRVNLAIVFKVMKDAQEKQS